MPAMNLRIALSRLINAFETGVDGVDRIPVEEVNLGSGPGFVQYVARPVNRETREALEEARQALHRD